VRRRGVIGEDRGDPRTGLHSADLYPPTAADAGIPREFEELLSSSTQRLPLGQRRQQQTAVFDSGSGTAAPATGSSSGRAAALIATNENAAPPPAMARMKLEKEQPFVFRRGSRRVDDIGAAPVAPQRVPLSSRPVQPASSSAAVVAATPRGAADTSRQSVAPGPQAAAAAEPWSAALGIGGDGFDGGFDLHTGVGGYTDPLLGGDAAGDLLRALCGDGS
jgi:hypothetical protein